MNEKIQKVAGLVATGKFWKEAIIMTLGMMVAAAAVYYFLVPSKLIIGTVSGLSIVLSGIFETFFGIQIKVSLFVVIINAILLVLAWLLIGEEFGAKTVYTAMILGPLMDFWAWVMPCLRLSCSTSTRPPEDLTSLPKSSINISISTSELRCQWPER